MKTNYPRTFNLELNRMVAQNTGLRLVDTPSVNRLGGARNRTRAPECLRRRMPQEPDGHPATPAAGRSEPVADGETASVLTLYMREIGQINLLSREEELALTRRAQAGDEAAREEMIKANLRLVVKIARYFEGMGLPLLDLISEGNIGLMKAVDRYDPAKGAKLSVYAAFWIKQCIRRALSNHARTIRVPVHVRDKLQTVHAAFARLQELLGRDPTADEVAQQAGLSAGLVKDMREAIQSTVSLDEALGDRQGKSVAETVADEQAKAPDEALAHAVAMQQLQQFLGQLNTREQAVLRFRFGLEGEERGTLDEIGRQLGLTRERVRQIQNTALAKLRQKLEEQERPLLVA